MRRKSRNESRDRCYRQTPSVLPYSSTQKEPAGCPECDDGNRQGEFCGAEAIRHFEKRGKEGHNEPVGGPDGEVGEGQQLGHRKTADLAETAAKNERLPLGAALRRREKHHQYA